MQQQEPLEMIYKCRRHGEFKAGNFKILGMATGKSVTCPKCSEVAMYVGKG